ncbi:unnamed protein product [Arabidopsis thaliana]|uniref:Transmembrane protein n=1 Tax=Arabidopsis thaliana TaxID=3702 RepID=A0A654F503_ARATH|nr:unnamed protein product [Arabidopsis thaliana]
MSMKFVFVLFLAVTSVMNIVTVQNVEGKRLLPEETSQLSVFDHEASPSVVIPQGQQCPKPCHVQCYFREIGSFCVCLC